MLAWHRYRRRASRVDLRPGRDLAVGAVAGISTGLVGMAGPPVLIYLLLSRAPMTMVRATLIGFFAVIYAVTLAANITIAGMPAQDWPDRRQPVAADLDRRADRAARRRPARRRRGGGAGAHGARRRRPLHARRRGPCRVMVRAHSRGPDNAADRSRCRLSRRNDRLAARHPRPSRARLRGDPHLRPGRGKAWRNSASR